MENKSVDQRIHLIFKQIRKQYDKKHTINKLAMNPNDRKKYIYTITLIYNGAPNIKVISDNDKDLYELIYKMFLEQELLQEIKCESKEDYEKQNYIEIKYNKRRKTENYDAVLYIAREEK